MTVMPRERQRTRQFALAVDGPSLPGTALNGTALDVALDDVALVPLARLAGSLNGMGAVAPTDAFKLALRNRLLAVGAVTTPARGLPQPAPWRRRLIAASAVVAISTGSAAGLAVASSDALPGDRLYEVKRAIENVRLALAPSDVAKAEHYLAIASTRLSEINAMLAANGNATADPVLVEELRATLSDLADAVAAGSALFFEIFDRTADASVLAPLEQFLAERSIGLSNVRELLPAALLGNQDSLLVEFEDLALRVANVTSGSEPLTSKATSAFVSLDRAFVNLDRAGRSSERDLISASEAAVAQSVEAMRAAAEAAQARAAAAAAAAQQSAQSSQAKPEDATPTQERVERDVRQLVEVNVTGRDGSIDQVDVNALPKTAHATRASTGSLRTAPTSGAGSASSRLLGMLPLPSEGVDAPIPGSLSASFDPTGARYAHLSAD